MSPPPRVGVQRVQAAQAENGTEHRRMSQHCPLNSAEFCRQIHTNPTYLRGKDLKRCTLANPKLLLHSLGLRLNYRTFLDATSKLWRFWTQYANDLEPVRKFFLLRRLGLSLLSCLKHRRLQRRLCRPKVSKPEMKAVKAATSTTKPKELYFSLTFRGKGKIEEESKRFSNPLQWNIYRVSPFLTACHLSFACRRFPKLDVISGQIKKRNCNLYEIPSNKQSGLINTARCGRTRSGCRLFWSLERLPVTVIHFDHFAVHESVPPNWPIDLYIVDIVDIVVTLSWLCDFDFKSF